MTQVCHTLSMGIMLRLFLLVSIFTCLCYALSDALDPSLTHLPLAHALDPSLTHMPFALLFCLRTDHIY